MSKENTAERNLQQSNNRRIKMTSNMYMFKVRAFQDVLKQRGHNTPLATRTFNYTQKHFSLDSDQEQPQAPKSNKKRHQYIQADSTTQQYNHLLEHNQLLESQCSQAKKLCEEQLNVLQETKGLLERQSMRNVALSKNLDESKEALQQSVRQLQESNRVLNSKQQRIVQLETQLKDTLDKYTEELVYRSKLEQQIKELRIVAEEFAEDISLLKESTNRYQEQLQSIADDDLKKDIRQEQMELINNQLQMEMDQLTKALQKSELALKQEKEVSQEIQLSLEAAKTEINRLADKNSKQLEMYVRQMEKLRIGCQEQLCKIRKERKQTAEQIDTLREQIRKLEQEKNSNQTELSNWEIEGLRQRIRALEEEKQIVEHQLEVVKSVVEQQKKTISKKQSTIEQLKDQISRLQQDIQLETEKSRELHSMLMTSRQTILANLQTSKSQSERQKQLFGQLIEENRKLKQQLSHKQQ